MNRGGKAGAGGAGAKRTIARDPEAGSQRDPPTASGRFPVGAWLYRGFQLLVGPLQNRPIQVLPERPSDRLKVIEILIALLFLLLSVAIGTAANSILKKQNEIVEGQARVADELGHRQYQASLLQAYVTANANAGYENKPQLRMLNMAIDLYLRLRKDDPSFQTLSRTMPDLTGPQLDQLVADRPEDRELILQLFGRRSEVERILDDTGNYHIVVGTYRIAIRAQAALARAVGFLSNTPVRPRMNVVRNEVGLYLATLSSFRSKEAADKAIRDWRLSTLFEGVYSSQDKGWETECTAQFAECQPTATRSARIDAGQ
ncbi:MAG TPA: hypothetical protein VEA61_15010 [Allosphingosinicella sp.]|nr:hypothetical protein [Allosphingosinicella sp.]